MRSWIECENYARGKEDIFTICLKEALKYQHNLFINQRKRNSVTKWERGHQRR